MSLSPATALTVADWPLYHYRAALVRIIDGDTAELDADFGDRIRRVLTVRLDGYNAPEIRGPQAALGFEASRALYRLLFDRPLYIHTTRDPRSFARYVGRIYTAGTDGILADVAEAMIALGHHVPPEDSRGLSDHLPDID